MKYKEEIETIISNYKRLYTPSIYGSVEEAQNQKSEDFGRLVELLDLTLKDDNCILPPKDLVLNDGYNNAKMEDYTKRNMLRHKDKDLYFSGWMDSYDYIKNYINGI